jgi:ceramide glucosyltransferase
MALGSDLAEDAAATKLVRRRMLNVRVVDQPFEQPLGTRTAKGVWDRQVRWARLRRATFPHFFIPEVLNGSLWPLLSGVYAASALDLDPIGVAVSVLFVWFGCEALIAHRAGWHLSSVSPVAWALRDIMLPVLWFEGWLGHSFMWRGNEMRTVRVRQRSERTPWWTKA